MTAVADELPLEKMSLAERIAVLKGAALKAARAELEALTDAQALQLEYEWRDWWARPSQLPPDWPWTVWLFLAGRGAGKTRSGAEWVRERAANSDTARIALVAPTAADVRDVMIEGESGILAISPPEFRPIYEPSKRRLTWPNGARAACYSADEPERLRGPQHTDAWCDEIAAWRYPETWDMLMFGLRLGELPQCVATTTPKPVKLIKDLLGREAKDVAITRASTYENRSHLAPAFFAQIVKLYEGTRMGRQEISAELLDDVPGALWQRSRIDSLRVSQAALPPLLRIVVAVDPAVTSGEEADETGIIVAGIGADGHGYVLADESGRYSPNGWAQKTVACFNDWKADRVIAEVNNGGDLVENNIRMVDKNIPYRAVHASRGKIRRAEPVATLYEQAPGRVHHVGVFSTLEDQMCQFTSDFKRETAGYSPDRMDALVWAFTELIVGAPAYLETKGLQIDLDTFHRSNPWRVSE